MSAQPTPLREKVQFQPNIPEVLQLTSDDGRLVEGRYGDQYMYTFADGRIAWLDPAVRDLILKSGARAGDEVAICKRETRAGNKRSVRWAVEKVEEEPAAAHDMAPAAPATAARTTPIATAAVAAPQAQAQATTAPAAAAVPQMPNRWNTEILNYADCFSDAAEVLERAEASGLRYLKRPVLFGAEDLRAVATTLFLQRYRGGAR
jgi:hypothetical protein